jgi:hypothetical protein
MGNAFMQTDWDLVRARANATARQLRAKGVTVSDFSPLPPIPTSQIVEFSDETGISLPTDFVELVTKFAGGWNFYWSLCIEEFGQWLKPPYFVGNFGGNSEVPFIGATREQTLLDQYRSFQNEIKNTYLSDPQTLELMPFVFPLHTWEGGGGDYTVLRLDTSPARIYYLDHEMMWPINDKHLVGSGFREFVLGWSNLGFPQFEYYSCWVDQRTKQPDDKSPNAQKWRNWLGDTEAA